MVLANVAAAEELERLHRPCMYRVHAPPSDDKLDTLRDFLATLGISLKPGNQMHPRDLDRVLRQVAGTPEAPLVNEVMLRSQSQAAYSPDNIGHFGLALSRYAHFTSPIRRYADLLVHRSLIKGLRLGRDGLPEEQAVEFPAIAEAITETERRAQLAERDAIDRYLAAFMASRIGAHFDARISGVTRFGLFVSLTDTGASGMVPFASLPNDYWEHDERAQTLTGRHSRIVYRLGQEVEVRLSEANPVTGGLQFQIVPDWPKEGGATKGGARKRGRPGRSHSPRKVVRPKRIARGNGPAAGDAADATPWASADRHPDRPCAGRNDLLGRAGSGQAVFGLHRGIGVHRAADSGSRADLPADRVGIARPDISGSRVAGRGWGFAPAPDSPRPDRDRPSCPEGGSRRSLGQGGGGTDRGRLPGLPAIAPGRHAGADPMFL